MYDADELERKIDKAFQRKICEPRRNEIVQFFRNILVFKEGFQLLERKEDLEVIDIFYYANEPLGSLSAHASEEFYDYDYHLNEPNIRLEPYNYFKVKELAIEEVTAAGISLTEADLEWFDPAPYWENQHELEMNFLIGCWQEAILQIPNQYHAFLYASDGSGIPVDLNKGIEIAPNVSSIDSVTDYLAERGIHPKKMLIERQEENESKSFWGKLFGKS